MTNGAEMTPDSAKGSLCRKGLVSIFALASDAARIVKTYVLVTERKGTDKEVFRVA